MTPSKINGAVIVEKAAWIREMLANLKDLGLDDRDAFRMDRHKQAAAESYLRRALEALFDMGRHILAKKFGVAVPEYKEVARVLFEKKVMTRKEAGRLRIMAGYRNRLVHFYHEIGPEELFEVCTKDTADILLILNSLQRQAKPLRAKRPGSSRRAR
jgi:uncharacterized protein YutE (UPF0331/DUF86 family)